MAETKPAIIPGLRRATIRNTRVLRRVKMLRPICATCQRGPDVPEDWWKNCTHNPYVTIAEKPVTTPVYEDLPDGRKKLTGTETIVEWFERPNWVQITAIPRVNNASQVTQKRQRHGFIMPSELRSPEFPNGIADCCEFNNCFIQEGVKQYRWGRYCRDTEARFVGHDARMSGGGGALEVGDSPQSIEKQRAQLEAVPI